MKKRLFGLVLFMVGGFCAQAVPMSYSLSGGSLSGIINGETFTDATWTITAIADPGEGQEIPFFGTLPMWVTTVFGAPEMTVVDGANSWTFSLEGWDEVPWMVSDIHFGGSLEPVEDVSALGFMLINPDASDETDFMFGFWAMATVAFGSLAEGEPLFVEGIGMGVESTETSVVIYNTSIGALEIESLMLSDAAFTVSPIPEPSAFAVLAGLGVLGFAAFFRRRA